MYEESLELTLHYKKLPRENQELKEEPQRVEAIRLNKSTELDCSGQEDRGREGQGLDWQAGKPL